MKRHCNTRFEQLSRHKYTTNLIVRNPRNSQWNSKTQQSKHFSTLFVRCRSRLGLTNRWVVLWDMTASRKFTWSERRLKKHLEIQLEIGYVEEMRATWGNKEVHKRCSNIPLIRENKTFNPFASVPLPILRFKISKHQKTTTLQNFLKNKQRDVQLSNCINGTESNGLIYFRG